jgi:hypothetical protein
VILTQILPYVDAAAMQLYADFERALYDTLGAASLGASCASPRSIRD